MNALEGRQQTTKGIWLSRAPKVAAPTTLVMDLEGCDGRERGEDDTSFERQSALFALATADVVLVNMWAKDVGRETGAGKPLLKTIFQARRKGEEGAGGARQHAFQGGGTPGLGGPAAEGAAHGCARASSPRPTLARRQTRKTSAPPPPPTRPCG
jgi:hypothetical protein